MKDLERYIRNHPIVGTMVGSGSLFLLTWLSYRLLLALHGPGAHAAPAPFWALVAVLSVGYSAAVAYRG